MEIAAPPFSSISAFDKIMASKSIASSNSFACSIQSFPVMLSPMKIFKFGFVTRIIFFISSFKLTFECILPAVSIKTTSIFFDFACFIASNATAAGSDP